MPTWSARTTAGAQPWLIDKLAAFGARQADLEPEDDFEMDDAA